MLRLHAALHFTALAALLAALTVIFYLADRAAALAHEAPAGWSYDWQCCNNRDCGPIPDEMVVPTSSGWYLLTTHETIPYGSPKIRKSQDGHFHQCIREGYSMPIDPEGHTLCLYTPGFGS